MTWLWIALGSALGGVARYGLGGLIERWSGAAFPWGTLAVNILGSFVIGLFIALTGPEGRWSLPADLKLFVTVGFCGGFTTFSSFSYQTLALARGGAMVPAAAYVAGSVVLCLVFVWAGYALGAGRVQ